jgi:choline dehydrogenase-like flavoprotein
MAQANHFDVIIIGTGAGGGTLAYHLAPSGKRILLLERGDWLPRERDHWNSHAVFVEAKYQAKETWYDKDGHTFHPGIHYYVGGNTKVYGAALLRLRKEDFGEITHYAGISPAWPLSYEDFEPYYTKAEHLYQVHGEHGIDPTEPPASAPYLYPPVSHEPRIQELYDNLRRHGHHPFLLPLGILLDEDNGKPRHTSRCIRCDRFDGFPRVTLNSQGETVLHLTEKNVEGHERLIAKLKSMLGAVGCREHLLLPRSLYLGKRIPIGGTAHQCGTIRFGRDPMTSALDIHCKAHDLDNLYMVDGSFFVSSGAVNPALTIVANALRVGDHLLERLR